MTDEQQRTLEQDIEEPAKATPPGCPKCGRKLIPIVYGYPSAPMLEASTKNLIKLGGCVTTSDDPEWWCEQDGAVRYVYDELITGSNADVRHLFK